MMTARLAFHQLLSLTLYLSYWAASLGGVGWLAWQLFNETPDDWGIFTAPIAALICLAALNSIFHRIHRHRADGYLSARFPGYVGRRYPVFYLLSHHVPSSDEKDGIKRQPFYSLAESARGYFVLKNDGVDALENLIGGKVLTRSETGEPLLLPKQDILAVHCVLRSDAEIAAAAVDRRSYGDRLVSMALQSAVNMRVKTRIIPFAAYLTISVRRGDAVEELFCAVPTNVPSCLLDLRDEDMGEEADWLKGKVIEVGMQGLDQAVAEVIAEDVMDAVHEIEDLASTASDLLNPDAASVASVSGDLGRRMALLIAARIRRFAGGHVALSRSELGLDDGP